MPVAKTITSLLLALPLVAVAAGSGALLEQLQADHAALLAAEEDFQRLREGGQLGASGVADYQTYLQTLRERVAADCRALAEAGAALAVAPPCSAFPSDSVQALPLDQALPLTSAGRTGALDAELAAGLSEFDELLLREQQRIRASAPRSAGGGEAAGGAAGSDGEQPQGGSEDGLSVAGAADSGSTGERAQQGQDSAGRPSGAGAGGQGAPESAGARGQPPPGTPDGSDDDVVARQMREAAEQETDPELQKKLWEEYRRYKQGIR